MTQAPQRPAPTARAWVNAPRFLGSLGSGAVRSLLPTLGSAAFININFTLVGAPICGHEKFQMTPTEISDLMPPL